MEGGKIVSYLSNSTKVLGFSLCIYSAYSMGISCENQELRLMQSGCALPRITALTRSVASSSCLSYFAFCPQQLSQSKLLRPFYSAHVVAADDASLFAFVFGCDAELQMFCASTQVAIDVCVLRIFVGFLIMILAHIFEKLVEKCNFPQT